MMNTTQLDTIARQLHDTRAMIETLQRRADALTEQLKGAMVDMGTEVLQGDGWKASWKNVTSSRFDSKSFKADHADLYTLYTKQATTTRFLFSA